MTEEQAGLGASVLDGMFDEVHAFAVDPGRTPSYWASTRSLRAASAMRFAGIPSNPTLPLDWSTSSTNGSLSRRHRSHAHRHVRAPRQRQERTFKRTGTDGYLVGGLPCLRSRSTWLRATRTIAKNNGQA